MSTRNLYVEVNQELPVVGNIYKDGRGKAVRILMIRDTFRYPVLGIYLEVFPVYHTDSWTIDGVFCLTDENNYDKKLENKNLDFSKHYKIVVDNEEGDE